MTVRDVIPQSRLALYGNYPYDNDREAMYNREKSFRLPEERPVFRNEPDPEPWMLPEVEKKFIKLIRNCSRPYDLYNGFKPVELVEVEESIRKKYPVLAKKCQPGLVGKDPILLRNLFLPLPRRIDKFFGCSDTEETLETIRLPNPFYRIEDLNQLELQMRITSTKHVWERPLKIRSPFSDTSDRQPVCTIFHGFLFPYLFPRKISVENFPETRRFRRKESFPHSRLPAPSHSTGSSSTSSHSSADTSFAADGPIHVSRSQRISEKSFENGQGGFGSVGKEKISFSIDDRPLRRFLPVRQIGV